MTSPYDSTISATESKYGIPSGLLNQLIGTESSYNPQAFNSLSGATGIAQIEPATAADPGYGIAPVNPSDPNASIDFAGAYLSALHTKTGSWQTAVQDYGTVGSGGPVNANQTALWNMAGNADNSGSGVTGSNFNLSSSQLSGGGNLINVVGAPGGGSGAGTGGSTASGAPLLPGGGYPLTLGLQADVTSWLGNLASSFGQAFQKAFSGIFSGLENWVTRGFLILIGIVIIAIAAWRLMAPNVSLKDAAMIAA